MNIPPYRHQLAFLCVPFLLAGILSAFYFSIPPVLLMGGFAFSATALLFGLPHKNWKRLIGFALFFLALGLLRSDAYFRYRPDSHIIHSAGKSAECFCVASSEATLRNGVYQIQTKAFSILRDGRSVPVMGGLLVRSRDPLANGVLPGDTLRLFGKFQKPRSTGNPGDFNYRIYLLSRGIDLIAFAEEIEIRPCDQWNLKRALVKIRERTGRVFDRSMPDNERNRSIALASLLGLQIELDEETETAFRNSGLLHVLAVSGFHTAFIATLAYFLLSLFCRKRMVIVFGSLIILWFYILLTGMPSSAQRAGVMSSAFLLSLLLERSHAPMNALAVSGIGLLLISPAMMFDAGFQLSFAATFGILLWTQVRRRVIPRRLPKSVSWFADALALSISASLFTLPILLRSFGQTAALGFLASIPAGALSGVILVLDLAIVGASAINPGLSHFYGNVNDLAIGLLCFLADFFSRPAWNQISLHWPGGYDAFYYLFLLGLFHSTVSRGRRLMIWIVAAALAFSGIMRHRPDSFRATFLDVGNGDAILLQLPGRFNVLVDCGPCLYMGKDRHESRLLESLDKMGVRQLEAVFLSHYDSDHACGLYSLLGHMPIGRIYGSAHSDGEGEEPELRKQIALAGIVLQSLRAGDRFQGLPLGHSLNVIAPCGEFSTRNDNSLALLLTCNGRRILLAGDVENPSAIHALASAISGPIDLLKAPHHGESGPALLTLVRNISPEIIVISNRLASRERELMSVRGPQVFSTSQGGAVVVRLAKNGLRATGPEHFTYRKRFY